MRLILLAALAALCAACSNVKPLVIASHYSDPTDGGVSDSTFDFIGAGAKAELGDWTIKGALGRKAINCDAFDDCSSTLGAMATVEWSPDVVRR